MSGDWIKMRVNLWDDPRVGRVCDLTGAKEATVIGALYWLWATADQHTEDGCLPGMSLAHIDRKTGVKGFAAALVGIDWLHDDPQGVGLVHFDEHNGASAKKRAQTARRVASLRAGSTNVPPDDPFCNAQVPHVALPNEDTGDSAALAREEKRREDQEKSKLTLACDRPPDESPALALVETPKPKSKGPPDCPHVEVLALWAEVLPALPQHDPAQWRGSRADHLRARWRETAVAKRWETQADGLAYLRKLFGYVGLSPFLTGREHGKDRRPFFAELAWLVEPMNWAKTTEGKYHPMEATA